MERTDEVKHHHPHRVPGIDGLRAFAVISVILYHLNHSFLPGGFVGVDVFFVISGYVVCASLLKDQDLKFLPFIGAFYVRRLLRIYPALIVLLVLTGALSMLFIPDCWLSFNNLTIGKWAFLGLSNFALLRFSNSYFAINNDYNPYEHTWSLAVEEQYYLLFPIALYLLLKSAGAKPILKWMAVALLPMLLLVSLAFAVRETQVNHAGAYFLIQSRFWELAAGALLRLAHGRRLLLPGKFLAPIIGMSGLVFLILSDIFVNPAHFPFPMAIPPVIGSALLISAMVVPFSPAWAIKPFLLPASIFVGRISYSVYLWHWVVIVLLRWTLGVESAFCMALAVLLTFAFAIGSFYWLEEPIQRTQKICQNHKIWTLVTGLILILGSRQAFWATRTETMQHYFALSTVTRHRNDWFPHLDTSKPVPKDKHWSGRQIFSIGDSHADTYAGMLRMLELNDGVTVHIQSITGQGFGSFVLPTTGEELANQKLIWAELKKESRPGDVVLLANLRVQRLSEEWGAVSVEEHRTFEMNSTGPNQALAYRQAEENVRKMLGIGLNIIIDAPPPVFRSPPLRGSDWFNRMNPAVRDGFSIERSLLIDHRSAAMQTLLKAKTEFPSIQIWDPMEVLCPDPICSAFAGSEPLFFDGDHLSDYAGRILYPSFKKTLEKFWK